MTFFKFTLLVLLPLTCQDVLAQYAIDSISLNGDLTKWYDQQAGLQNTLLQHGELAILTRKSPNSHAYYGKNTWAKANITYCDQTFSDVSALYNIEDDVLIIENNLGPSFTAFPLKLRKELVAHFAIGPAHFVYISDPVAWHGKGFFKLLYDGESIALLSKVFKKLELKYGLLTYKQMHYYYLKKEGRYYRLKRLSGLLKLFPDHKRQIRQYKKQLSVRDLDEPANEDKLSRLIEYCDNL